MKQKCFKEKSPTFVCVKLQTQWGTANINGGLEGIINEVMNGMGDREPLCVVQLDN